MIAPEANASQTLDQHLTATTAPSWLSGDREFLQAEKHRLASILAPDEVVWIGYSKAPTHKADANPGGYVVTAGRGEQIHSIRLTLSTVPMSWMAEKDQKQILDALSALYARMFPAWPEAAEWPIKSAKETWERHVRFNSPDKGDLKGPDDIIVRKQVENITTATFGVPPDVLVFVVSVRDKCLPRGDHDNPFGRLIC
jgi:hypothetical protein